jgi:uncharacterized protein (DUF1810 family)
MAGESDRFDLGRFVQAQERVYARVLEELGAGLKRSHWMWFIFPQIAGLGSSPTSQRYAIGGAEEARAYLAHPVLGARLRECTQKVLNVQGRGASEIFGYPDDLKLRSCMTLFAAVSPPGSVFERVLAKHFQGRGDELTSRRL